MYKKKLIILSITLVMLILTVGIAYAYFSASYIENTNEEMLVSGDIVLRIDDINVAINENMIPGDEIEKKFSVTNTSDYDTMYSVNFTDIISNFANVTELVYKYSSEDGGESINYYRNMYDHPFTAIFPKQIAAHATHTYTLKIKYKDITTNSGNNINNMGKKFSAKIKVNETTNIVRLKSGGVFNKTVKELANPDVSGITQYSTDNNITQIQKVNELDTTKNYVNIADTNYTDIPVYAWYDNGIIKYYTEADRIYLFNMNNMFYNFNGLTTVVWPSDWDTSNVSDFSNLFFSCSSLTNIDLSNMDTSSATDMTWMFNGCRAIESLDLSNFYTTNVTSMNGMFSSMSNLISLDIDSFDTSNISNMAGMFSSSSKIETLDLRHFNTSSVTDMSRMFYDCELLSSVNLSSFNTINVTNMSMMFRGCYALISLDLRNFNTINVTNMSEMFCQCNNLTSLNVSSFNTSVVTNMRSMFNGCYKLTSLNIDNFDTSLVTNMQSMFSACHLLTSLNLNNFNTSNVTDMSYMFQSSYTITELDLSSFNTSKVTNMQNMFVGNTHLITIYVNPSIWDTSNVTNGSIIFSNNDCLVGGNGTRLTTGHMDISYAHVDEPGNPGYFTLKV